MATQSRSTANEEQRATSTTDSVQVIDGAFDPWRELANYQDNHLTVGQYGATATCWHHAGLQ